MKDALLTKYLLKETDEIESSAVRKWIDAHPDHERRYRNFQRIWETSQSLQSQLGVDEERAWDRFVQRRDSASSPSRRGLTDMPMRQMRWLRYAAVLLLFPLGAGLIYYFWDAGNRGPVQAAYEATTAPRTDTLADGTIITLNRHAAMRYTQDHLARRREAMLEEGEVFFNVKRDPDRPFVVRSGKVSVTVLGTSFHVKRRGDETFVTVETGRVRVVGAGHHVELTAGQTVSVNTLESRFETGEVSDQLNRYYVANKFVLDNTPLWRIVDVLREAYGADIRIENPQIRDLPMTTIFEHGELDGILRVIGETLRIRVTRNGDAFILK